MKTDIDPEFEASVARVLHSVRDSGRVEPWPDGLARVAHAARRQQRSRASFGAAGVAACVAASVVGVGALGTRRDETGSNPGASTAPPSEVSVTAPPSAYNPSMDPSAGIEPPSVIAAVKAEQASASAAIAAAEDIAPDASVIPPAELTKLHALALHLASVWGDDSPTRMEVVYTANSRAVDAALGSLGTPIPASYTLEMEGSFSCNSCDQFMSGESGPILVENYDDLLRLRTRQTPDQWLDLSRFGRPVTLAPANTTSTPRPHPSDRLRVLAPAHNLTLDGVRQWALQQAVDPSTATVMWSEQTTLGDLEARSSSVTSDLPPGTKVFVVAVDGRLTNEKNSWARWAFFESVEVPTGKGGQQSATGYCGEDLCGLSAPAP